MDISFDSEEITKKCFQCDEHVICNLNIVYNASNTTFILWNKFQMFFYEGVEFETASNTIVPEFLVQNIITSNNYLICMDCAGNVHTTPLKFKNTAQKRFKYGFQPRDDGMVVISLFNEDHALCLKYESHVYFLSVHKINTEFSLVKRVTLISNDRFLLQQNREKYLLKSYLISDSQLEIVKKVFQIKDVCATNNYSIVFISFDKLSVYSCLFSLKTAESEINLVKLYTCPVEIASIDLVESDNMDVMIGLTMGTIICLTLNEIIYPRTIHLNTAIYKLLAFNDTVLYTDGMTLWKAEHILAINIKFSQFFIKDVKDFIKFGDQIICTTFNNIIYTFSMDDERSYVKPQSVGEYYSAETVLSNANYLEDIKEEINKSQALIKMQIEQKDYITALCLTNRQDVMDGVISKKVIVYESYGDAISEHPDAVLTNQFSEYFDIEYFYILIKITAIIEHSLANILSNSIGDLRIHITITSKNKIIKSTTVKVSDVLRNIAFLIPLKMKFINTAEMRVETKIVTIIPGALDPKQKIWIILYRKSVALNSDNFIKFNFKPNNITCLKDSKESLEKLILQTTLNQYGSFFEFTDITEKMAVLNMWQMYIRLPSQYEELFKNAVRQPSSSKKVNYFLLIFSSEDFLRSRISIWLNVAKEKVKLEIDNDGFSTPTLKISSSNAKIALDMRNFLSNLIHSVFGKCEPGKQFISHSFYITVENLQRTIRECVTSGSEADILPLIGQFERKIIGSLPI